MKNIIQKRLFWFSISLLLLCTTVNINAQKKKKVLIKVSSTVVGEKGEPIADAAVFSNEGKYVVYSDEHGKFITHSNKDGVILIECDGYESVNLKLGDKKLPSSIRLTKSLIYGGAKDQRHLPMLVKESTRNMVGASTKIDGDELTGYDSGGISNALQGKAMGLMVFDNVSGLTGSASLYVRGQSSTTGNAALVIVDGIERSLEDILPEEIESVEVLKDATAKILYGSRATSGVILITTKRGVAHKKTIKVNANYGIGLPTRLPKYLDSYDYATLYNEARENDGLGKLYSDKDLDGYKNSTGVNDLLYPNVDYYNYFLKNSTTYSKFTTEFSGGNSNTRYSVIAGYENKTGLQAYGQNISHRFNIRGNLNIDITKDVSAFMGMAAIITRYKRAGLYDASTFSELSSHRPNEYPLLIDEKYIPATRRGIPALGSGFTKTNNLLGDLKYKGSAETQKLSGQMTMGLNAKLSSITKGLSAKAYFTFDNQFYGQEDLNKTAATYEPYASTDQTGASIIDFKQRRLFSESHQSHLSNSKLIRTLGFTGQLGYKRKIGIGTLNSTLGYFYYQRTASGNIQDNRNDNIYLRANYSINNKYIIEGNVTSEGSNKFVSGNRRFTSYAFGAGWIMSEENFLKDVDAIDFLKIKASYGLLGYDGSTDFFLYENRWHNNGNVAFGNANKTGVSRTAISYLGNPDLKWEKYKELNIGLEGLALNKRLSFSFNYFNENRSDLIGFIYSKRSAIYGNLHSHYNYGEIANRGFEGEIHWKNKIGDLTYRLGGNFTYAKNEVLRKDEVKRPESYLSSIGKSTGTIMGYKSLGLYGKDVPLKGAPTQTFGPYGEGDIAYADINGDNIIDGLDKVELGRSFPTTTLGIDVNLNYKGWGLYILGTAGLGAKTSLSNSYYRNQGEGKYSILAKDRYHPVNNPSGNQPRLTTTTASNNSVSSDFWLKKKDYFRLRNIELSYTFKKLKYIANSVKIYARATNVFVISSIKDSDPEIPNAGVSNYPRMSTITGGVSVSF